MGTLDHDFNKIIMNFLLSELNFLSKLRRNILTYVNGIWNIDVFLSSPLWNSVYFKILIFWKLEIAQNILYEENVECWCLFFFFFLVLNKANSPKWKYCENYFFILLNWSLFTCEIYQFFFFKQFKTQWWNIIHTADFFFLFRVCGF